MMASQVTDQSKSSPEIIPTPGVCIILESNVGLQMKQQTSSSLHRDVRSEQSKTAEVQ